jgi:hypothetical protein
VLECVFHTLLVSSFLLPVKLAENSGQAVELPIGKDTVLAEGTVVSSNGIKRLLNGDVELHDRMPHAKLDEPVWLRM